MEALKSQIRYYGKKSKIRSEYDWIVRIDEDGCFVTDPVEDWEKDDDYRDEALSNSLLYELLDEKTARRILSGWNRELC
ncbi:MAG: hypothetical protein WC129_01920 [Sphaerochaetaceae bacterium]|nr:hypothetical protein [Sphaerochaetaceae bacterium]MDX9809598.1 hypothetical protein [Sphaerochaetaceae bacterium]NLV84724.1 hypothetical protein [Spirochaetales bacterium]